ncbi:hypothetical protein LCM23_12915 [Cytobacillus kochii]|uniref:hypothetical protein n=1 Tax=Cytobacillus kochii TaxID=859143 RepID=UPI001CD2938C|nr:hypothetical protein [Cytobacillus kochii]MCA1026995.1 hypothetical protein [Cytobacillus kochii]
MTLKKIEEEMESVRKKIRKGERDLALLKAYYNDLEKERKKLKKFKDKFDLDSI